MEGLLRQVQLFTKRHGSTILTGIGGVGVIITSVAAVKATPKALIKLEEAEKEKGEKLTKFEVVKAAGPSYIPALSIGATTISCIFGANAMNKKQQAALVSAYALINSSYKQYKQKLIEIYGKETHDVVIDSIAVEKAKEININAESLCANTSLSIDGHSDPVLFYDVFSNRYFESTIEQVLMAEYHFNRNFVLRGVALLNEFYEFLGLEPTDYGSEVGWTIEDEMYWIDFDHRKTVIDDVECYVIETPWGPSTEWKEYYW
jgi:hypothetical protein